MPRPFSFTADALDLRPRVATSVTVVGSPAAASETIIAQVTAGGDVAALAGVVLFGWAAYTVGTSGTAVTIRLRQTNVGGTVVANSGALTQAAAALFAPSILGFDAAPVFPNQVYVMTMTVTAGAAVSTVSAVQLTALVI